MTCATVWAVRSILTTSLAILLTGCATRPHIVLPGTQYRITEVDGRELTLSPPVERVPIGKAFSVQFPVDIGKSKQDCEEANDLFRLRIDRKKRLLLLEMPSLNEWQALLNNLDKVDFRSVDQKVDAMVSAPERLADRGCLGVGSAIELRHVLRDSIPVQPGQDLYARYGYRPGGLGFDVRPGMRLKVQRAHFEGAGRTVKDLIGTSTVYYPFLGLKFGRPVVELDTKKLEGFQLGVALAAPARPIYRLFFLTSYLKQGLRRSALLLGAKSVTHLQEMERKIAANPAVGCEALDPSACVSFEGDVTVSAEVSVTVNGVAMWAEWGTPVASLLRKLKAEQATDLRLRRAFQGHLVPFDSNSADQLKRTALVAGDELSYRL